MISVTHWTQAVWPKITWTVSSDAHKHICTFYFFLITQTHCATDMTSLRWPVSLSLVLSLSLSLSASVFEKSVSQRSVQDAGERWRLRLGGESQRRHPHCPTLQVQTQLLPATLHPLCYLCPQVCVCVCWFQWNSLVHIWMHCNECLLQAFVVGDHQPRPSDTFHMRFKAVCPVSYSGVEQPSLQFSLDQTTDRYLSWNWSEKNSHPVKKRQQKSAPPPSVNQMFSLNLRPYFLIQNDLLSSTIWALDYHQTLKPNYGNTLLISSPPPPPFLIHCFAWLLQ